MKIRATSISYSKRKAKNPWNYKNELTNKAQALLREFNETHSQQTINLITKKSKNNLKKYSSAERNVHVYALRHDGMNSANEAQNTSSISNIVIIVTNLLQS